MAEKRIAAGEKIPPIPAPPSKKTEAASVPGKISKPLRLGKNWDYDQELGRLQIELVKLHELIRHQGLKVVILFEGRDAAGKGGAIQRIAQTLTPRICRVVALGTPTEREKSQWYFQRYVAHLPGRRRDGSVRPQLVQPGRGRARDGILYQGRISGIPAQLSGIRADAGARGHHPAQVLVLGERRRTGAPLSGPHE